MATSRPICEPGPCLDIAAAVVASAFIVGGQAKSTRIVEANQFRLVDARTLYEKVSLTELFWGLQGQFFPGVGLGTVNVGQRIIAELSWDQPNSQFVAGWTDVQTGKMTQALTPYTVPDSTPPAAPDKLIGVRAFAPNCVGTQMMFAHLDLDATFDKVWIGN